jgi:AbrB family transcriptional regulator (stage V sporulation protein T)
MLLETGTISEELLEQSSFVGTAVNFKWDTKSISNAHVVHSVKNQRDKAFSVNVIYEGDPLEIYTEKDGGVIFRKYSPMGDLQEFAAQMCESIGSATGHIAAVADRDSIIALHGVPKRELMDKPNSQELEKLMEQRRNYRYKAGDTLIRASEGSDKYHLGVAAPILSQGDLMGCVMLLLGEGDAPLLEADQGLAQTVAGFLGKQMES